MRNIRIVITVDEFDPDKGYLEYFLASELVALGQEVYVFTFGSRKSVQERKMEEGFNVIRVPSLFRLNGYHVPDLTGLRFVRLFCKNQKPNVVHCQPLFSPLSLAFVWAAGKTKSRVVGSLITGGPRIVEAVMRGEGFNSSFLKFQLKLTKLLVKWYLVKRVQSFFSISKGWKQLILRLFSLPSDRIKVIPLGADHRLFKFDHGARARIRRQLGFSLNDIVIIFCGHLIRQKEVHILIEGAAPLIRQRRNIKVLIVGNGDKRYLQFLESLCLRLGISTNVVFHSWVHRTKLPEFYSASDIAVWPGGPTISAIEAASVGLPLIVKRSPLTEYIIEYENGLEYANGDIDGFTSAMDSLVRGQALRRVMGQRSRKLIVQKLNWKTIAKQFLDEYLRVTGG